MRRPVRRATHVVAVLAVALSACARSSSPLEGREPTILVPSPVWRAAVGAEAFTQRVRELSRTIEQLREQTGSGWVGRQDDVTGYLTELTGGRYGAAGDPEAPALDLIDQFGLELFGVGAGDVALMSSEESEGVAALRGEQRVGEVPVIGGSLVFTVRDQGGTWRLGAVRGKVFPGAVGVDTDPAVSAREAVRIAEEEAGGVATAAAELGVLPFGDGGVLVWQVPVVSESTVTGEVESAVYLIDAGDGAVVEVRPTSAEVAVALPRVGPAARPSARLTALAAFLQAVGTDCGVTGDPVEVTGSDVGGEPLVGSGLATGDGVALVDTEVSSFDPASGSGAVCTHDASGLFDQSALPGPIFTSGSPQIADRDAIASHVYARYILNAYRELFGRDSWDGEGGSLTNAVHFSDESYCNAFFTSGPPALMAYGEGCVRGGVPQFGSYIDPDVAGHEITHGVTSSSADLIYAGQPGALNESFSDYIGNVIGDRYLGRDSDVVTEQSCGLVQGETLQCATYPDGTRGMRQLTNGAGWDEYARLVDTTLTHKFIYRLKQDNGGVHLNSAIWNNALWQIRKQLAAVDGTSMLDSERAAAFDRAVYGALTRYLVASSGFVDARSAVEQSAAEVGMDGTSLRIVRQVFDQMKICSTCAVPDPTALAVSTTAASQRTPVVSGDDVAWLDLSAGGGVTGVAAIGKARRPARALTGDPGAWSVAFAGSTLVTMEGDDGTVARYDVDRAERTVLEGAAGDGVVAGVAGSDEGAAWVSFPDQSLGFVDPAGKVTTEPFPGSSNPWVIGTGGGTVVTGSDSGQVVVWRVGSDPEVLGTLDGPVMAADVDGDTAAFVVATPPEGGLPPSEFSVVLYDLSAGTSDVVSRGATFLGVTIDDGYMVWAERVGDLDSRVLRGRVYPDTDLYLHSVATGRTYVVKRIPGQQGYPQLDGRLLVWQDAVLGGDDIFAGELPSGL